MMSATRPMLLSDLSNALSRAKARAEAEDVVRGSGVALLVLWKVRLMERKRMLSLITLKSTLISRPSLKTRKNLNRDYTPRQ